jgi:hypothetical protein
MQKRWIAPCLLICLAALAPPSAAAFSFGSFGGDRIASLELTAGDPNLPAFSYVPDANGSGTLSIETSVTTINLLGGGIIDVTIGDLVFSASLRFDPNSFVKAPAPPVLDPSTVAGDFAGAPGASFDFEFTDEGDGGVVVLQGVATLALSATEQLGGIIVGEITSSLLRTGGDPNFMFAFGPSGTLNSLLTSFKSDGANATDLCHIVDACPASTTFDDFTTNPTSTIQALPEPSSLLLLGLAALGLAGLRTRR